MNRGFAMRAARFGALAALAAACVSTVAATVAAPVAWAEEASLISTFNDAYTAWPGYATTAAESSVPGAVPVSAPASAQVAWSAEADACAVRQQGQSTFLYAVSSGAMTKYDASSGSQLAQADLDAPAAGTCSFVDGVLLVPLIDGRLAAYDEDLACAWVSDAGVAESTLGDWSACSTATSGVGCAYLTYIAYGEGRAEATVGAFSLVDGSLLWERALDAQDGASEEASVPVLSYVEPAADAAGAGESEGDANTATGMLIATDGSAGIYLLDAASGSVLAAQQVAEAGCTASAVVLPEGSLDLPRALALASSDGAVQLWGVDNAGSLVAGQKAQVDDDLSGCTPVACNGSLLVAGSSGMLYELSLPASIDESVQVNASIDTGASQELTHILPVAYGDDARSMTLVLYVLGLDNSLYAVACDGVDIQSAMVEQLAGESASSAASDASVSADEAYVLRSSASAPVVNRDGTLYVCAGGTLTAFSPDADRTAATAVGGSNGLDTIGGALTGISLPNGVGLGVGVLVFAIGFGAYAYIRNGGGRRAHDEGLDEWRAGRDGKSR